MLGYGDVVPTSKTQCEKLRFGLYVWEKLPGGGTSYVGAKWKWGTWSGFCQVPEIEPVLEFDLPNIEERGVVQIHESYRFAMSARRYSAAKDSSSSYVRRKIRSRVEYF